MQMDAEQFRKRNVVAVLPKYVFRRHDMLASSPSCIQTMPPTSQLKYIWLSSDNDLPVLEDSSPFKVVLVLEEEASQPWQWEVARWLVRTHCRCVMVWGTECEAWREAIEDAHLEAFDYEDIPADQVIVTTSHEDEDLSEVFWYCRHRARHPLHELPHTVILHVSKEINKSELEGEYADAER